MKINKNGELSKVVIKKIKSFLSEADKPYSFCEYDFKATFKVKSTTDIVVGDLILWIEPAFSGSFRNARFSHYDFFYGRIGNDSYSEKGQHTFTILDFKGNKTRKKGRTLFKEGCFLLEESESRDLKINEKHKRGKSAKITALETWLYDNLPDHPRYEEKKERLEKLRLIK